MSQLELAIELVGERDFFFGSETACAAGYARATGSTVERRHELCQRVLELLALGRSQRRVASETGISREVIRALADKWESEGKLRPARERVARKLMQAAEAGTDHIIEALDAGILHPAQLPVPVAIMIEKAELLSGGATQRIEVVAKRVDDEDLLRRLREADAITIESDVTQSRAVTQGVIDTKEGAPSE